ncbi:MAG: TRAP transporter small permease [Burkholderiaceae bacterium]
MNISAPSAPPAPPAVTRLLAGWHWLECAIAMLAYVIISVLLISDVFGREFVGPALRLLGIEAGATGLFGSQKIALYAMIVGSFLGLGIATATGVHLLPRIAFGWVPKSWGPHVNRIADVVTGLVVCAIAWYAWIFVQSSREAGTLSPVYDIRVWMVQLAIPIGFLSAGLRYFIFALWPAARPQPPEFQE